MAARCSGSRSGSLLDRGSRRTSSDERSVMTRSKSIKLLASTAVIALAAVPIAACGGGGGATGATPPKTTNGTAATVGVADTSVGKILVDSRGRSLYLFKADTMTKSACTAACAAAWSPLLAHG